jgi:hypothetical protein
MNSEASMPTLNSCFGNPPDEPAACRLAARKRTIRMRTNRNLTDAPAHTIAAGSPAPLRGQKERKKEQAVFPIGSTACFFRDRVFRHNP